MSVRLSLETNLGRTRSSKTFLLSVCVVSMRVSAPSSLGVAGVEEFAVGDEVFGIAPGCLGHSVVAPAQLLVPKPPGVSFVDAATTPTTYVTVYTAFGELSSMRPGTKVGLSTNSPQR